MIYMNFDDTVLMTRYKDYKGVYNYVVIYGLEITKYKENIEQALSGFNECVEHSLFSDDILTA